MMKKTCNSYKKWETETQIINRERMGLLWCSMHFCAWPDISQSSPCLPASSQVCTHSGTARPQHCARGIRELLSQKSPVANCNRTSRSSPLTVVETSQGMVCFSCSSRQQQVAVSVCYFTGSIAFLLSDSPDLKPPLSPFTQNSLWSAEYRGTRSDTHACHPVSIAHCRQLGWWIDIQCAGKLMESVLQIQVHRFARCN